MSELIGLEESLHNHSMVAWFVGYLWQLMDQLGRDLAAAIAPHIIEVLAPLMLLFLTWYALRMIMLWGSFGENMREAGKVIFFGAIATSLLAAPDQLFALIIAPIVNTAATLGQLILLTTIPPDMKVLIQSGRLAPGPGIGGIPVAEMVWLAESQIDWVIFLGYRIVQSENGIAYVINFVPRFVAALPLLILGIGLLGLFTAYSVEAIFKFLAGALALPLAVAAYIFPLGRAYSGAVIRLFLAGAFTLVLLTLAMGFTGRVISVLEPHVVGSLVSAPADEIKKLKSNVDSCASQDSAVCEAAKTAYEKIASAENINVFGPEYTLLIVCLLTSIILHMSAKTLASNLSGVNDGPGPAAAVVGLATAGAGLAWGATKWAAVKGAGPLAKGAEAIGRRLPIGGGGSAADGGQSGGATSRRVPTADLSQTSAPSSPSPSPASAPPDMTDLNRNLEKLNNTLKTKK